MLTTEQAAHITVFMRVSNLLGKNPEIVNSNPEMKVGYEAMKQAVDEIMTMLPDEEKDELLERYRIEAEQLGLPQPVGDQP